MFLKLKFQSPYGDFGTLTYKCVSGVMKEIPSVSVPLRGFWYADSVSQYPLPDWAHRRFFQTYGFLGLFL